MHAILCSAEGFRVAAGFHGKEAVEKNLHAFSQGLLYLCVQLSHKPWTLGTIGFVRRAFVSPIAALLARVRQEIWRHKSTSPLTSDLNGHLDWKPHYATKSWSYGLSHSWLVVFQIGAFLNLFAMLLCVFCGMASELDVLHVPCLQTWAVLCQSLKRTCHMLQFIHKVHLVPDEHVDYWISQSIRLPAQNGTRLWSPDS